MAKLYLKQKVFSWGDKFTVYNQYGEDAYRVKGEVISLGKKLHVYDLNENEIAFIHQKLWTVLKPKYFISRNGVDIAQVVKEISFIRDKFTVAEFGWFIEGNILDHEYQIKKGETVVASVTKKWVSWGDSYEIDIADGEDEINVLCAVLIIDAAKAAQQNASSST